MREIERALMMERVARAKRQRQLDHLRRHLDGNGSLSIMRREEIMRVIHELQSWQVSQSARGFLSGISYALDSILDIQWPYIIACIFATHCYCWNALRFF